MNKLLKKNFYFCSKFNNVLFKKGKKYNSEKIFNNFFLYSKKNKNLINNVSSLNKLFLKKMPFGTSKSKRFGKNYKEVPYFFSISRGYKEILKNIFTKDVFINKKTSTSVVLKRFFLLLSQYNRKQYTNPKEVRFLKDYFLSLKLNKSHYKFQW